MNLVRVSMMLLSNIHNLTVYNMTKLKPYKIFTLIGLIWGMIFVFVTPPFQVPDEFCHFFRAYQVSEGTLFSKKHDHRLGGGLPKSLLMTIAPYLNLPFHPENKQERKNITSFLDLPLNPGDTVFVDFPNTALYSPIPYFPQSFGIIVGKFFNVSPLILVYLGRMSNLILWILCVSTAIKITPIFKWLFILLALTPMSLFEASSLSADCFTNAISFLATSMFLYYAFDNTKIIKHIDLYILFTVTLLLTLSKHAYVLIIVLYLLIPIEKIGSSKKYYSMFVGLVLFNGIILAGWSLVVQRLYIPYESYNNLFREGQSLVQGVFPDKQFEFIFSNFVWYLYIVVKTFWTQCDFIVNSFIGCLGWLDTPMPPVYLLSAKGMFLFFAIFERNEQVVIYLKDRFVLFLSFSGTIFLFSTLMYMSWTPVGQDLITGLQGRYFIPISWIFFLLWYNRKFHVSDKYLRIIGSLYVCVSLSFASFVLIKRFYL